MYPMFDFKGSENSDAEFAFWLEHTHQNDLAVFDELINQYAVDITWLLDSLLDICQIHPVEKIDINHVTTNVFHRIRKQWDHILVNQPAELDL
jgi:hypothetical protein